jgi:outer membrane protein insertion porin family
MYLDITIEEGPLYRFGAVSWSGNEKIIDAGFSHFIVVDSGAVYNEERILKSREQLQNAYMDIGHIGAQVFPQQKPVEGHIVNVHFDVVEKDPWTIRKILITGNTKTKDRVIRRELRVRPGDTFSQYPWDRGTKMCQLGDWDL